jgi:ribosome-binding factor A
MRQKRYPRQVRVAELLRQALCELLARSDEVSLLTLHRVELTNDYSIARIYYSLLDESPANLAQTEEHFAANVHAIRNKVAARLQLRSIPRFEFHYADDLRKAEAVTNIIDQIRRSAPE